MRATRIANGSKTVQAIAHNQRRWHKISACPRVYVLLTERLNRRQHRAARVPLGVGFDGGHKGDFVFRTAPHLSANMHAAKVGVVELDPAF